MIIALSISTGKEGALYDLENLVLPAWRDGNKCPEWIDGKPNPDSDQYLDDGIGLEYTDAKQDPDTKHRIIWIKNIHGGFSKIILISIPYAEAVEARVKGPAPSFIYVEEITNCSSDEYFTFPCAQMARRREMQGRAQQFYASCNPEGPSHWVYKTWWRDCVNEENGQRDPDFQVFHVPIQENLDRLPPGYIEHLTKLFKDPIQRRRLINGEWVDRPSGNAIFKDYFAPEIHQKGDALKGIGWIPIKGIPIIVGYDPGPVNFSIHLLQMVPTKQKTFWMVFDEINCVGHYTPYRIVIPKLLKRMDYWNEKAGSEFKFAHIAPEDAFNQVKSDGSFDSAEIEKHGNKRIKLRSCPQAKQSVPQRVQMVIAMLLEESLYISATCPKTLDMMRMLVSKKVEQGKYEPNAGHQPLRSVYVHSFDSMTYPIFYFALQPGKFIINGNSTILPQAYLCGQNG